MKSLGLIGLGLLGSALAERFISAGYSVTGFDTSEERREQFRAIGGVLGNSANSVFQDCSTVVLSLPNSKVVSELLRGCFDLIEQHLIIDTTTGAPEDARHIAADLEARGACYLDATVVGSSVQAPASITAARSCSNRSRISSASFIGSVSPGAIRVVASRGAPWSSSKSSSV